MPGSLHPGDGRAEGHAGLGRVLEEGVASWGCCRPGHWPLSVVFGVYNSGFVSYLCADFSGFYNIYTSAD